MAEHEADREDSREPEKSKVPADGAPVDGTPADGVPLDEDAAWRAIVAGYGEEPADPPGAKPFKSIEDLALLETETNGSAGGPDGSADGKSGIDKSGPGKAGPGKAGPDKPLGSSVSFAPGVGPGIGGPRDYTTPEPSENDFDADDEGHFVPPEPPPLPEADVTAKFAWLAVLGGPLLILLAVLFGWQMTWWLTTLGIGGFLGGFATLVMRMNSGDDEEDDDPGRGAVV
ncbi:hypothetical protein [Streptomyces venezuelae]|uniref:DUF308 domain-containing protein n=1 Tax=Streptomyces venezuelae TaxID=54571 RepID=A0A5P2B9W2_STRVZ|nr:hypothetical protein [Streptomyces venezuelae]QES26710.1 hypothetical protein DEJ47_09715 [Streptomyces venezuelae]